MANKLMWKKDNGEIFTDWLQLKIGGQHLQ